LGLAFAFSHLVHAMLIAALAYSSDDYRSSFDAYENASGFVGYVFLVLMTATSFKPMRRFIGERNWKVLHTSGMWIFAYVFWKTNYELLPQGLVYVLCLNVMSCAIAVQLIAKIARELKLKSHLQKT
jgi:DMSO/TMAO reductase YedYZ heme-binding membrane subunit